MSSSRSHILNRYRFGTTGIVNNQTLAYFIGRVYLFLTCLGIDEKRLWFRQHFPNEMAHYVVDCWDAEIESSYGWIECVGIADRSAYELLAQDHLAKTPQARSVDKSGVALVAQGKFAEPKEVEKLDITPNKKELGLALKGHQKMVTESLKVMMTKRPDGICDDLVPSAEDTEAFETDESAPTHVPSSRRCTARMSIRPQTPMSATAEALIAEYASAHTPPSPPPSLLSPLSSLLLYIPSPPLPLPSPPTTSPTYAEASLGYKVAGIRDDTPEADIPLQKRARFTAPASGFEARESSAVAARQPILDVATVDDTPGRLVSGEVVYGIEDVWDDMVGEMEGRAPTTLEDLSQRVTYLSTTLTQDTHEIYVRFCAHGERGLVCQAGMRTCHGLQPGVETLVATLVAQTSSLQIQLTTTLRRIQTLEAREPARTDDPEDAGSSSYYLVWHAKYYGPLPPSIALGHIFIFKMPPKKRTATTTTTTPMTDAQIKALITQGVADALVEIEANRTSRNGDDNHDSRTGSRRTKQAAREYTYNDFLKCQPLNFKGTEGVVGLTQCALTWWNSHVKAVGHNAAYEMTLKSLMKMLTDKYYPRGEIKKLEIEIWNLKVKGTDVASYTQRF
ncbi:reverse transcriptase domain-containing protein [Tanacetum coccineum]